MSLAFEEFERRLDQAYDSGKIFHAHALIEQELRSATGTDRASAEYNLGVSWRSRLGNGVEARRLFNEVANISTDALAPLEVLRANARENSMLLALSYDEYDVWADMLREIRPSAEILKGQYPLVVAARQKARPWLEVLQSFAGSYYKDGDPHDPKCWAEAAATYQLMLANRELLRLDRTSWGRAATRYAWMCLRLNTRACPSGTIGTAECPEDPSPLLLPAVPYLQDYLRENPHDAQAVEALGWVHGQLKDLRASRVNAASAPTPSPNWAKRLDFFSRFFASKTKKRANRPSPELETRRAILSADTEVYAMPQYESGKTLREAIHADKWAEIDGDQYVNQRHGVVIGYIADWIVDGFSAAFWEKGGFIALRSPDDSASISVSSMAINSDPTLLLPRGLLLERWEGYVRRTFERDCGREARGILTRIPFGALGGERELVRFEYAGADSRVGRICVLHAGDEFVIDYRIANNSPVDLERVFLNWKWRGRLYASKTGLPGRSAAQLAPSPPAGSPTCTIDGDTHLYLPFLFSFRLQNTDWKLTEILRDDRGGTLLISAATSAQDIVEAKVENILTSRRRELIDKHVREPKLQGLLDEAASKNSAFPRVTIDSSSSFANATNAVSCRWLDGARERGVVSVVHDDFHYDIIWSCSSHRITQAQSILEGFHFHTMEEAEKWYQGRYSA